MATTWDPTAKSADVTLSNGNLTARQTSGAGGDSAGRANVVITTGQKRYWEHAVNIVSDFNGPGLANATQTYPASGYLGNSVNSIAYFQDGTTLYNNVSTPGLETYTSGDVICVAVDFSAGKWWVRKNGGNWNNSGTANPATNTGGLNIQVSGNVYPGYSLFKSASSEAQCTANFGATAFAFTPPSGFAGFDLAGSTSIAMPAPALAAAGTVKVQGSLSKSMPAPGLATAGQARVQGVLSQAMPALALVATGTVTSPGAITGTASITMPAPVLVATGTVSGGVQPGLVLKPGGIPSRARKRRYERQVIRTYEPEDDEAIATPVAPPVKLQPIKPAARPASEAERAAYRAQLERLTPQPAIDPDDDQEEEALMMLLAA